VTDTSPYTFSGFFSVAIGFPCIYGALLLMGIPRVGMTGCYGRKKLKKHDSIARNVNAEQDEERAPLVRSRDQPEEAAPPPRPAPASVATPPSYFPSPVVRAPSYQEAAPPLLYAVADDEQLYNK
jgi:hypothetical protein